MAFNLGDIFVTLKAKTDDLERGLAQISAVGKETGSKIDGLKDSLTGSFVKAQLLVDGLQALGQGVINAGKAALSMTGEYEQSRVAFETMLGSADKARKMLEDISDFAKTTPFELPGVIAASKQLLAFGLAQEDIIPTMRRLGDIAAGVGVPVGQLSYVYGQVRLAGKLMAQDLMQFTNAGVPLLDYLSQTMGKTAAQIKKDMDVGMGPSFQDVQKAIETMTNEGGKFGGMMEKQSKTFDGVVSNIKDGFGQMLRSMMGITPAGDIIQGSLFDRIKDGALAVQPVVNSLASILGPAMQDAVNFTADAIGNMWRAGDKVVSTLKDLYKWLDQNKIVMAAVQGVLAVIAADLAIDLVMAIGGAIIAFGGMAVSALAAAAAMAIALAPFLLAGAAVGVVVYLIITYWSQITAAFAAMWAFIVDGWNNIVAVATVIWEAIWALISPIIGLIIGAFQTLWAIWSYIMAVILGLVQVVWPYIWAIIKPILDAMGSAFKWLGDVFGSVFGFIGNVASSVWNAIAGGFKWAWQQVSSIWSGASGFFGDVWNKITSAVGGVGSAIGNAFAGAFNGVRDTIKGVVNWMIDRVNGVINGINDTAGKLPGVPKISNIPRLFKGVRNFVGGMAMVGDQGAEIINLPRGTDVHTANESRQMLNNASRQGQSPIQIILDGANITSPHVADQYGEAIGNAIVRRLMQNTRI